MTGDNSTNNPSTWPLPKFSFAVDFGNGQKGYFSEVSGLSTEAPVEYRHGGGIAPTPIKMPGIKKPGNITIKRGILTGIVNLANFTGSNGIERRPITISLVDESGATAMSWTLANAFPVNVRANQSTGNEQEVAVESLEIAHEGIVIVN